MNDTRAGVQRLATHHRLGPRLVALAVFLSCGRSDVVRYSTDGSVPFGERGEDGGLTCVDGLLAVRPAQPVVSLVVDRSTSMSQSFPGTGTSKWNALRSALHEALPPWNEDLALGLTLFPAVGNDSCGVSSSPELSPQVGVVSSLLARLDATAPGGSTPTALAVERASANLAAMRAAGASKALVLATDGAPDCNATLDPRTCTCLSGSNCSATRCLDDARTIERLQAAVNAGIPTWVVGLRSTDDARFVDVLNRLADAGGRPQVGSQRFFSAASQLELENAFAAIRAQVSVCHYLTSSVPNAGGSLELRLDDVFIPYDVQGVNGWTWIDSGNGEFALHGDACTKALARPVSALAVWVRCGP